MPEVDITELIDLEAERVAGVTNPANGTHFLVMKAAADDGMEDCSTCKGTGKIMEGNRDCPDCEDGKVAKADSEESSESEAMETMVTKADGDADGDESADTSLSDKDRDKMPASSFAFVDKDGGKHLPIHDPGHVKSALGRFAQQKFDNADDPAAAKKTAAKKIVSAAKKHGINLDDKGTVSQAAKSAGITEDVLKGAIQEALNGTGMPKAAGHLETSETAKWFTEAMTSAPATGVDTNEAGLPGIPGLSKLEGGESPYGIPAEGKINGPAVTNPGAYVKGTAAAQLLRIMEDIQAARAGVAKGTLTLDNVYQPDTPSMSFAQVATNLAQCAMAIDAMIQIHAVNGVLNAGDPDADIWDLQDLNAALECALGIAAKLSFEMDAACTKAEQDGEPGEVIKTYRRLRVSDEKALRDAHSALSNVLTQHDTKAGSPADDDSSEEDKIVTEVTKSELAEMVVLAAKEVAKQEREADEAKQAEAAAEVAKNANNGGDITEGEMKPTETLDAANIGAVTGAHSETAALSKELDEAKLKLEALEKQVQKFAKQPRQGGPILDGQLREGARGQQEAVSKSEVEGEIERLEKSLGECTDPLQRDALGQSLTHQKLLRFHLTGQL